MSAPIVASDPDHDVIAVTGATGFIGQHLMVRLNQLGRKSRALVRSKAGRSTDFNEATQIIPGGLNDPGALQQLLNGAKICVHLAGATKSVSTAGFHSANVIGTFNVAACAAKAGVEHFICVSSQAARAPEISDYAASKASAEAALDPYKSQMRVTVIRPPAVIGPGDPMLKPMLDLIRGGWLPAPSEPRSGARSFAVISVNDLVERILQSVTSGETEPGVIEPCSVPATTWQSVGAAAGVALNRRVRVLSIWSGILRSAGFLADGLATLVRRPMPISHGKVRELLAADWTYDDPVQDAMNLEEILRACFLEQGSNGRILSGE